MKIFAAVLVLASTAFAQTHQRGAEVMGFDLEKTTHHFLLYTDGGAIDIAANDAGDRVNRDAIRSHLPHIAMMFGQGDFNAPMLVHQLKVPGTDAMAARKNQIRFSYVETPRGGRVDIVTTDATALAAVHEFLRFQIADHHTGDPTTIRKR